MNELEQLIALADQRGAISGAGEAAMIRQNAGAFANLSGFDDFLSRVRAGAHRQAAAPVAPNPQTHGWPANYMPAGQQSNLTIAKQAQGGRSGAFTQQSAPDAGGVPWSVVEQLKNKYGAGAVEAMVANPEKYGAQIRNMAQEFGGGAVQSAQPSASRPWAWGAPQLQPEPRRTAPPPWQINPMVWDSLGNVGQQLALGSAEESGYDADDWMRQLNASRPQGRAPRRVRTQYAQPRSAFGGYTAGGF